MKAKSTPDERFLCKLYEMALATGDWQASINAKKIGSLIGLKETALKNIIKHLAQANFIKKQEEMQVYLTERGRRFVEAC